MPRCQRTFRRLPEPSKLAATAETPVWVCPWCAEDHEVYEPVRDDGLREYARLAQAQGIRDFGSPPDPARSTALILGLRPECVYESVERRYNIYLQRGSDAFQLRLQIGHEVFHRLCSLGRIFHWSHEMLACLQSVRLLDQFGASDYAERMRMRYRTDAERFPLADLLAVDLRFPPPFCDSAALYGRAFVLGEVLCAAAGWPALCRLARCGDTMYSGEAGVTAWLRSLDAETAATCVRLMDGAQ